MNDLVDPGKPPPLYRRKYLLNARFQMKYTTIFILLSAVVAGLLGARLYGKVRENSQLIAMEDNPEANGIIQSQLKEQDERVLYEIAALLSAMVVAIAIIGVWVTHKVAGPALVLTRALNQLAEGKIPSLRPLRKNDELLDLFQALHAAMIHVEREVREQAALMDKAAAQTQGDLRAELLAMSDRLKNYTKK